MSILACILPVVNILCQPVVDAVETCIGNQAQRFLSFLTGWAEGLFLDRGSPAEEVVERGSPAENVPESVSEIVGAEETLSEIRNHLSDDSVRIVGIFGMGGAGKTTILKRINNEFLEPGRWGTFDLVIWVTVSQTVSIPNIQQQIAQRLGLPLSGSREEDARNMFRALSKGRLLVLLDDLWEPLDHLEDIGIPAPGSGTNSKLVFTTRLLQVCSGMDAKVVPVKRLDGDSSWELFCCKLGTNDVVRNNPTIRLLAEQVVHKCGGLPLSLVTVGRAMASRVLRQDWEYAIKALDRYAERLQGMDKVLRCLKFSYDYLKNDGMRSALLFCAMYEEDAEITSAELIRYWVGEGLLDEHDAGEGSIDDARGAGQDLITELQNACLLEPGTNDRVPTVRMHDAVRDMALWINGRVNEKVDGFLVYDTFTPANIVTRTKGRGHIKRVRVRSSDLEEEMFDADEILGCSSSRTLLLTNVRGIGPWILHGIASSMKSTLRVLDLSHSDTLGELPGEVGLMTELRFLDLSFTKISSLPKELGNLIKLRQLVLIHKVDLQEIPREAIAGLRSLQVLHMWDTVYDWEADPRGGDGGRQLGLGDLEASLHRLQELRMHLGTPRPLERFLRSKKLCRCTIGLCLEKPKGLGHRQSEDPLYGEGGCLLWRVFSSMGSSLKTLLLFWDYSHPWEGALRISLDQLPLLEYLCLYSFRSERMPEVVLVGFNNPVRLSTFRMSRCDGLKVLKLVGTFPCLEVIYLYECSTMEELALDDGMVADVGEEGTQDDGGLLGSHFPMLREIHLSDLPALKGVGRRPLRLPALRSLKVDRCRELRRIPLDAADVPKLEMIRGERKWWDAVACAGNGGHDTKPVFEKLFRAWNWRVSRLNRRRRYMK